MTEKQIEKAMSAGVSVVLVIISIITLTLIFLMPTPEWDHDAHGVPCTISLECQ